MNTLSSRKSSAWTILLVLVTLASLVPALFSLILSLIQYQPARGLFGSPFAGLQHYAQILSSFAFTRVVANSFLLWLVSLGAALLLGLPVALLGSLAKDNRTLASLSGLVLLPALIPASVTLMLLLRIFPSTLFASRNSYVLGYTLQTILPGAALVAFAGLAFALIWRASGRSAQAGALTGSVSAALLAGFQMLQPSYEASLLSANPLVYEIADTLDTFNYRTSLMQMNISQGAAVYVLRSLFQFVPALLAALVLFVLLRKSPSIRPLASPAAQGRSRGTLAAFVVAAVLSLALLFAFGRPAWGIAGELSRNLLPSLLLAVSAAIIAFGVSCLVLFGAAGSASLVTVITGVFLLTFSQAIIGQYIIARALGLIGTFIAPALTGWLQPSFLLLILLFALLVRFGQRQSSTLRLAFAGALAVAAQAWGGFMPAIVYLNSPQTFTYGLLLRNMAGSSEIIAMVEGTRPLLVLAVLVPCLLLGFAIAWLVRQALIRLPAEHA